MKNSIHFIGHKGTNLLMSIFFSLFFLFSYSQQKQQDTLKVNHLDEVLLNATRVKEKSPFPFTNMTKKELEKRILNVQ